MNKKEIRNRWYDAVERENAACGKDGAWEKFSNNPLPSKKEAKNLCANCPLLGEECKDYRLTKEITYGVLDGIPINTTGLKEGES